MFDTDKYKHGLIDQYEQVFLGVKEKEVKILEVGVLNGGFLLWLADYFPKAKIFGVDINLPNIDHERIVMTKCDQNDWYNLNDVGAKWGGFDIIIDDGCHRKEETENTFKALFPYLKSTGIYIVEDFIAGYWPEYPAYKGINELVFDIARDKNKIGISNFNILLNEPKCSLAIFQKI